jgi:hypothetical protein
MSWLNEQSGLSIPVLVIEVVGNEIRIGVATVTAAEGVPGVLDQAEVERAAYRLHRSRRLYRLAQETCGN